MSVPARATPYGARLRRTVNHSHKDCLPNQSLEPTATAVTPRADARVAPAVAVAHH